MRLAETQPSAAARVLRLLLGGLFLYAAYDKLLHPDQFAEIMTDYRILPLGTVNLMAAWLPMAELVVGLALLTGIWVRASALTLAGISTIFLVALIATLARGLEFECGCFTTTPTGQARTWASLWQEALLLVGCLLLWMLYWRPEQSTPAAGNDRPLPPT